MHRGNSGLEQRHRRGRDERLLCWFQVAPNGVLLGWGNFFDGVVNQHYYGPVVPFGPAKLPKFGATSNGSYRFEYLTARFSDEPPQALPETE